MARINEGNERMFNFNEMYPAYDVDEQGNVYKQGHIIKPFKSNKYLQVVLFDKDNNKRVYGVHTIVAMKYLDYFPGCVIHHKNNDTHDNRLINLTVLSRSEHSRLHGMNNARFKELNKNKTAWNKGLKMPKEFCKHCSISAKKRWAKKRSDIV